MEVGGVDDEFVVLKKFFFGVSFKGVFFEGCFVSEVIESEFEVFCKFCDDV